VIEIHGTADLEDRLDQHHRRALLAAHIARGPLPRLAVDPERCTGPTMSCFAR
jgi:hypothetical protein